MKNRPKITLNCPECGKDYEKDKSEYNRNQKLGRICYCSNSCSAKARNKDPELKKKLIEHANSQINKEQLKQNSNNRRDEFTSFRNLLKCTKQRKQHENNLDLEYLKNLWQEQKSICPYTKILLELPEYSNSHLIHPTKRASIDRIDSSKGYIKGNVQYVSTPINYMKNTMSHEETLEFLQLITKTLVFTKD